MLVPHLPPNLLLVLAYLLKTQNIGATAAILRMSQPSVSRQLARLRALLEDPLLVRTGSRMARTPRADALVDRLSDWVATTAHLLEDESFDPARLTRRFRIASTDFGVLSVCAPALPGLHRDAPGLSLDIQPLSHAPHQALASGNLDFALSGLEGDTGQLHRHLLFEDRFLCVGRAGHPAMEGAATPLELETFLAHDHLGLAVSDAQLDRVALALGARAQARRVTMTVPYFALAPRILAGTDLLMVVPARAIGDLGLDEGFAVRPAPEGLGSLRYWLLWHARSHADPASQWLRARLCAAAKRGDGPPLKCG